ncbi:MAG: lipopolysaccharide kinase InaA family protein [Muribaculaceae bacterium]
MKQNIEISPKYASLEPLISEIADHGVPSDAQLIYKGRNRVFSLSRNSTELSIKAFRKPRFLNAYIYGSVRKSKARRSYEYAARLLSLGIGTPEPVAYIENYDNGRLMESYYICLQVDGHTVRDWERLPDSQPLIDALAREMVRMHRAGVYHKDFSPGNILYTIDDGGAYHFYHIDLNRMEFGIVDRAKLMRNFRAIHLDMEQTLRLARAYARAAGVDAENTSSEAEKQVKAYRSEKTVHKFFKNLFRHG